MLRKKITLVCLLAMLLNVCVLPAAAQMETENTAMETTSQETVPTTEATVVRETEPPAVDYVDPTEFPQAETVPETTAPLETEPVAENIPEETQPAETEPEETPNPADRLAAGEFHNVWISADGTVNAVGKVGAYSGAEKWHNVTKVAAWNLTIGVRKNGKVVLAGDNTNKYNYGVISGWSDIVDVAAGEKNIAAVTAAVGVGRSRSVSVVNDLAAGYQFLNTCLFQHILKLVSRSKYDFHPTNRVGIHCRFRLLTFAADAGTELTEITQLYGNTFV